MGGTGSKGAAPAPEEAEEVASERPAEKLAQDFDDYSKKHGAKNGVAEKMPTGDEIEFVGFMRALRLAGIADPTGSADELINAARAEFLKFPDFGVANDANIEISKTSMWLRPFATPGVASLPCFRRKYPRLVEYASWGCPVEIFLVDEAERALVADPVLRIRGSDDINVHFPSELVKTCVEDVLVDGTRASRQLPSHRDRFAHVVHSRDAQNVVEFLGGGIFWAIPNMITWLDNGLTIDLSSPHEHEGRSPLIVLPPGARMEIFFPFPESLDLLCDLFSLPENETSAIASIACFVTGLYANGYTSVDLADMPFTVPGDMLESIAGCVLAHAIRNAPKGRVFASSEDRGALESIRLCMTTGGGPPAPLAESGDMLRRFSAQIHYLPVHIRVAHALRRDRWTDRRTRDILWEIEPGVSSVKRFGAMLHEEEGELAVTTRDMQGRMRTGVAPLSGEEEDTTRTFLRAAADSLGMEDGPDLISFIQRLAIVFYIN